MERGFDEVKAMIKFSYAELDGESSSLEAGLARLEVRVQKVEARCYGALGGGTRRFVACSKA